jgi:hypothetical protein
LIDWIRDQVEAEGRQWFGNALIVERRYVRDLMAGMQHDGLLVK